MAKAPVYKSANYAAYEMRGGGMILRDLHSDAERFFQPGDDANALRTDLAAIEDEIPEPKREIIFDMIASNYF